MVLTAGIDHFDTVGGRVLGKVIGGAIHMVSDATLQIVENVVVSGSDAIHTTVDYALSDDQFIAVVTLIGAARNRAGNAQSTTLTGNALENTLAANLGNDTLTGLGGGDVLNRGAGNDSLLGGKDADTLDGPSGADRVYGENGDDVLRGRAWADFLDGGADDDRLSGSYAAATL